MTIFVVLKSLKNDPMEIDSIWSTYEMATKRVSEYDTDEYYERYGSFQILQMRVDEVKQ